MKFKKFNAFVNEAKSYNLGTHTDAEYDKIIGDAVRKLDGIDAYHKMASSYGQTAASSVSSLITITQYGKTDNTKALKKILKKADSNLDVNTIKNNFDATDNERSGHDKSKDIWTYTIRKKIDYHEADKLGILVFGNKNVTDMDHEVVMELINMMGAYTSKANPLADIQWRTLKDFMSAASDYITGSDWKEFQKDVKSEYPILESKLNESVIGIKTDRSFKPKDLSDALDKAKIKYKMNRLSMTLSVLNLDKKYYDDAKQVVDDLGLIVMMAKESVNESNKYSVAYSDGIRSAEEFKTEWKAIAFAKALIKTKKGLQFVSVHKPGMHQTAHQKDLLAWWGPGSYWDNVAKKDKTLYDIQLDEATITLDALEPEYKPFLKYLKKHNIKMDILPTHQKEYPASATPEVRLTGKRKDLEAIVADDKIGWDDAGLKDYIEEGKVNEDTERFKLKYSPDIKDTVTVKSKPGKGLEDVTISWGKNKYKVTFEEGTLIDDHGNEGKDYEFVADSDDEKWQFRLDVYVEASYPNTDPVDWDWETLVIEPHPDLDESVDEATDYSDYSLSNIAAEIRDDWKKISPHAAPYLDAMGDLENITDNYFMDSGVSIVAYFLSNASSWRGSVAKDIKKELNKRLKDSRG